MKQADIARHTSVGICFDGVDITKNINPYFQSLSYTDVEDFETDDLQIKLYDPEKEDGRCIWLESWLCSAIENTESPSSSFQQIDTLLSLSLLPGDELILNSVNGYVDSVTTKPFGKKTGTFYLWDGKVINKRLRITNSPDRVGKAGQVTCWIDEADAYNCSAKNNGDTSHIGQVVGGDISIPASQAVKIKASIFRHNFNGDGKTEELPCGEFELDDVDVQGPPTVVTLKASSLSYSSSIRQTKKDKAWESYYLQGIANEICYSNGLSLMFLSSVNPKYTRMEQSNMSDIEFLSKLCINAGLSLKVTSSSLIIFDQCEFEKGNVIFEIIRKKTDYSKYKFSSSKAGKEYSSCRVSYVLPSGQLIEAVAKVSDYDEESKSNQQLEIRQKVSSIAEAQTLAEKKLRLHNKFARRATFTLVGNPNLVSGVCVNVSGFGYFDGKYFITKAVHKVDKGYTTQIELRRVLEGY